MTLDQVAQTAPAARRRGNAPAAAWPGRCCAGIGQTADHPRRRRAAVRRLRGVRHRPVRPAEAGGGHHRGRPGVGQRGGRRHRHRGGDNPDQLVTDPRQRTPTYERRSARASPSCTSRRSAPTTSSPSSRAPTRTTCTSGPVTTTTPNCPASRATSRSPGTGCPRARRSTTWACWPPATPSWWRPRTTGSSTGCCRWPTRSPTWATTPRAHCDGVGVQTGAYDGVFGREITVPSDYAQVLPVPHVDSTRRCRPTPSG